MEKFIMSQKEREQVFVFRKIQTAEMTKAEAARFLRMTPRWIYRKYARFLKMGDAGIAHQSRNKKSPKKWNSENEGLAIELLKSDWGSFGPTFTSQKLKEIYGIKVSDETLRKAMIKSGVWNISKRKTVHRQRRPRRPCLGMMIQLDGSPHDWFEGRAPHCTLLIFIDDVTSRILWLEFAKSESLRGIMRATKNYILKYGRPQSFYVDFGSVFSVNTNNPDREKITQFERAMKELGIEVIHARNPQAKGRVERANKTLQDRLIKEMRLANVCSVEEANSFVHKIYLPDHNQRFAVAACQPLIDHDLSTIFCIKENVSLTTILLSATRQDFFSFRKNKKQLPAPLDS